MEVAGFLGVTRFEYVHAGVGAHRAFGCRASQIRNRSEGRVMEHGEGAPRRRKCSLKTKRVPLPPSITNTASCRLSTPDFYRPLSSGTCFLIPPKGKDHQKKRHPLSTGINKTGLAPCSTCVQAPHISPPPPACREHLKACLDLVRESAPECKATSWVSQRVTGTLSFFGGGTKGKPKTLLALCWGSPIGDKPSRHEGQKQPRCY